MKDKSKIVLGVLALIFGLLALFFGIKYNQVKHIATDYEVENQQIDIEYKTLVDEFENVSSELELIEASNKELYAQLEGANEEVEAKKQEVRRLLNKERVTRQDLDEARKRIAELRNDKLTLLAELELLANENDSLKVVNRNYDLTLQDVYKEKNVLQREKTAITVAKQQVETEKEALEKQQQADAPKVAFSQVVPVKNIYVEGVKYKNSGKEKVTNNYKRIDKLAIGFTTEQNPVAENGKKEYVVRIITPEGTVMYDQQRGSGTFKSAIENEGMKYTTKTYVEYEKEEKNVSLFWRQDLPYQKGDYLVEIYQDGYKVGESSFELKGGL